jgi:hypothetical protein
MKNRLFIVGRFTHNPQGILAAVGQLALMDIERGFNFLLRLGLELRVAVFAYAEQWRSLFHDPKLALWHDCQFSARSRWSVMPVDLKRHHYQLWQWIATRNAERRTNSGWLKTKR